MGDSQFRYDNPRLHPKNYIEGVLSETEPSRRLRQMLARGQTIVAPGVYDGISARCVLEADFDCMYISGAATTASRLGQPDVAIATLNDFVQNAQTICSLDPTKPVLADADTGFGGPPMIARTVKQYERAGLAGLHIEDQIRSKRCGHLLGKQLVSKEEWTTRIRAAVMARDSIPGGSDFLIIARTDSLQSHGFEEALDRLKLATAAGADVCFLEGVQNSDQVTAAVKTLAPHRVLLNVVTGGQSPNFTIDQAKEMGVGMCIFPLISAVPAVHAIRDALRSLKDSGNDVEASKGMGPKSFFGVMGLSEIMNFDEQAGSTAFEII